jgi:hypothetical protein
MSKDRVSSAHLRVERRFEEGFERRRALRALLGVEARKHRALEVGAVLGGRVGKGHEHEGECAWLKEDVRKDLVCCGGKETEKRG